MRPRAIIQLVLNLAIIGFVVYLATSGVSTGVWLAAAILSLLAANAVYVIAVKVRTSRKMVR